MQALVYDFQLLCPCSYDYWLFHITQNKPSPFYSLEVSNGPYENHGCTKHFEKKSCLIKTQETNEAHSNTHCINCITFRVRE